MPKKILSGLFVFSLLAVPLTGLAIADEQADSAITAGIHQELREAMNWPLDNNAIEVVTEDGTVYLRGKVSHETRKNEAEDIARDAPGVRKVVNELDVYDPGER